MTRSSRMCRWCGGEEGYCECELRIAQYRPRPLPKRTRDGCAEGASELLSWPIKLTLWFVAAILVWAVWSGVPT